LVNHRMSESPNYKLDSPDAESSVAVMPT